MTIGGFLKDNISNFIINLLAMAFLSLFLAAVGNTRDTVIIIVGVWFFLLAFIFTIRYKIRKKYLDQLMALAGGLEERYLIAEVMQCPRRNDDMVFYQIIKFAGKSMLEQISNAKRERVSYRRYIDQWIHEIKTPLTAMQLLCKNHKTDCSAAWMLELEKINHYTEQALYYARSETAEKDYVIHQICLADVIHHSIAENKQLLLQNKIHIRIENCGLPVFTDEKWLAFILNQLIVNAVKYRTAKGIPELYFYAALQEDQTILSVQDNGIGIPKEDLPRIFEMGFTGENGRKTGNATGLGLYLAKRLCDKLGIGINACSEQGETSGTAVHFIFFRNHYLRNGYPEK